MVPPQPLIKALPELFAAKQEPVREGVKKLTARHRTCGLPELMQPVVCSPA